MELVLEEQIRCLELLGGPGWILEPDPDQESLELSTYDEQFSFSSPSRRWRRLEESALTTSGSSLRDLSAGHHGNGLDAVSPVGGGRSEVSRGQGGVMRRVPTTPTGGGGYANRRSGRATS